MDLTCSSHFFSSSPGRDLKKKKMNYNKTPLRENHLITAGGIKKIFFFFFFKKEKTLVPNETKRLCIRFCFITIISLLKMQTKTHQNVSFPSLFFFF